MKKIKFRVWNNERKVMRNVNNIDLQFMEIVTDEEDFYEKFHLSFDGHILMQFIGLLDKNKEDIFVGDILNWDDECTILIKEKDELGFYYEVLTQKDKNVVSFDIRFYRSEESAEIIGNKFENPELKEVKDK